MAQVFISYSQRDRKATGDFGSSVIGDNPVDKITNALTAAGISYWIDEEGLDLGEEYAAKIASNIKNCDIFLFLASQNANNSKWTLREISMAMSYGKKVLPVRLDKSEYADSVALYLSPIQYIDWSDGEEKAIAQIIARIQEKPAAISKSAIPHEPFSLPKVTKFVLYAALVFLTFVYALISYQLLWAKQLRGSQLLGGLTGYLCEFGVLISIYYIVRMLRGRRCTFIVPALTVIAMLLGGMLMRDSEILVSGGLLLGGWLVLLIFCLFKGRKKGNFFAQMSKSQTMLRLTDVENLILLYLLIKCCLLVVANFAGASVANPVISPYMF